tara:strand:+ start:9869 stop:10843 length:975 start_codon:yes stop_codon:yes gene_type:complete
MPIDPVTLSLLAKGAGKLLGKIGPAVGSALGARSAAKALEQDPEEIAQQYADLKANMPQYGVGSAFNEYLAMSKQDPAADMQRQIAAEQEASSIGALKAGGAKALLGGLGASQRQAARQRMGIEADSAKRQQSALAAYGAQQQRVQDMNTGMEQRLLQSQFAAERGAEQYNRQLEAQKKQATGQALGAIAGQFGKGNFKDLNFGVKDAPVNYNTDSIASLVSQGLASYATPDAGYGTVTDFGDEYVDPITSIMGNLQFNEDGGMITKGAFSHETNPIDIMQDGAKVGEMTGGEAILNPDQQNKVAKQSPYFRKLMREFAMRNRK